MALYSASQLIGKTMLMNKTVDAYNVADVDVQGDKAPKSGALYKDATFVIDSYLASTDGYTDEYNITYAPRKTPYFTYFDTGVYKCVPIIADGRFSIDSLKEQGALNVQEEIAQQKADENSGSFGSFLGDAGKNIGDFFGNLFTGFKPTIIAIIVILIIVYLMPIILAKLKKPQTN